jgi:hypothetical protein
VGDVVLGFVVKFYRGAPKSADQKPYFQSECWTASQGFKVSNLATGKDYVVVYEGYSTTDCASASLVARGYRGGIEITTKGTDGYYYIQVNRRGVLTAFPLPGEDLNPTSGGIACTSDEYCRETIDCPDASCPLGAWVACAANESCANGEKYVTPRVHPLAVCDTDGGSVCRLASLFPLNTRGRRAFHAAAARPDGSVSLLGGFSAADASRLAVKAPGAEAFAGDSCLFENPALADYNDEFAMGAVVASADGSKVILIGGAKQVGFTQGGDSVLPVPQPETCSAPDKCSLGLSNLATVVDVEKGSVVQTALPFATVGAQATLVAGTDGGTRVLVRTDVLLKTTTEFVGGAAWYLCDLGEDDGLACEPVAGTDSGTKRTGSTGVCIERDGAACKRYLVIGGNTGAKAEGLAELFDAATGTVTKLAGTADSPKYLARQAGVLAGGKVLLFGGQTKASVVDAQPMIVTVDAAKGTVAVAKALATDSADALRVFHTATVLPDGATVLVAGGVDASFAPVASALLYEVGTTGKLAPKTKITMATARVGHAATLLTGGVLEGSVLLTGGLVSLDKIPRFAEGAEIFVP